MRLNSTSTPLQLEESNRTLTVDVANLASEKEELNNQLKEMQQRECYFYCMIFTEMFPSILKNVLKSCLTYPDNLYAEGCKNVM